MVGSSLAIFIRERISGIEILTTTLFAGLLQVLADKFLDIKYDLYGYFDKGLEWKTLIYVIGIYPAVNIIFLNYFPRMKDVKDKILYILCWWILGVVFEILFMWTGTFYYNSWKLWYSVIIYLVLYLILVLFHKYTCYLLKQFQQHSS
ncbi:MAG: CBO0543 family protein [Ectobacillus sp.]